MPVSLPSQIKSCNSLAVPSNLQTKKATSRTPLSSVPPKNFKSNFISGVTPATKFIKYDPSPELN